MIYIEELTEPSRPEMQKSLNRMATIVESMHKDAIIALKTKDEDLAKSIIKRDEDINQLSRFIFHIATQIFQDISKLQSLEFSIKEGQVFIILAIKLENAGDYAVAIANYLKDLVQKDIDGTLKNGNRKRCWLLPQ